MKLLKIFVPVFLITGLFAGPSLSQEEGGATGPSLDDQRAAATIGYLLNYGNANSDAAAYLVAGRIAAGMKGAAFAVREENGNPATAVSMLEAAVELAGTDSDIGRDAIALIAGLTDESQKTEEDYYVYEHVYMGNGVYCTYYYWYDDWGYYLGYEVYC